MATDTVGVIYDIITGNLFKANISNARERLECAERIADAIGRNPIMEAPRNGVLLHYSNGNGCVELILKTDPPIGGAEATSRVLKELLATLGESRREHPIE